MFCKLYLGVSLVSESAVAQAFLQHFRDEPPEWLDHGPVALMEMALEESNCADESGRSGAESAFERAVLEQPQEERTVFILHGVLDLQLPWLGAITQLPFAAVDQPWIWSSLQLLMSTVKDDCSRLLKEFDIAPNAAAYTWA